MHGPHSRRRHETRPGGAGHSQIFCEAGTGRLPTIVIAGFLPDATESIEYQREHLARYGDVYYLNYPRDRFSTRLLFAELSALIRQLNARGERPVLFSICFGSGLLVQYFREAAHAPHRGIAGLVMVSPVLCAADMARLDGGGDASAPLRERAARMFFFHDCHDDVERGVAKARRAFTILFRRERVTRLLNNRNTTIMARVLAAVDEITVAGYYERALALKALTWPAADEPIFHGPALVLFAEDEDGVFVPSSPTLAALRRPSVAAKLFPGAAVHEVASSDAGDPVVHGSIAVHHHYFNPFIIGWYEHLLTA
ncbi:MAG TPA: alpha/beta hydrolase [bacterium]|nr:alpha/beta hydrolase [bacterium]